MSAWRLLIREIHTHGPMYGTAAQSSEIYRARRIGLIEHDADHRWQLTPLGTEVCEGRVMQVWWRPGGYRWVATWLRALPRPGMGMSSDPRYPLGTPVNRPEPAGTTPVPGRPNWWRDRDGTERYVEPPKKTTMNWGAGSVRT